MTSSARRGISVSRSVTDKHWEHVKLALNAVLEKRPPKRHQFLDRLCRHDPELLEDVRTLLESYDDEYLEEPPVREPERRKIGPYEVLETVGTGGMGIVYKVADAKGKIFALKRFIRALVPEGGVSRFQREAKAIASLDHPNIVRFVEVGEYEDDPFIVMEFLEGMTLKRRMAGQDFSRRRAVRIAHGMAKGLQGAHDKGIVHRDLKPGNIFLTRSGDVKILDFGIVKLLAPESGNIVAESEPLTRSGEILGTPEYMAPEQARAGTVDVRCDVFALGSVLYEMLSGRKAFQGRGVVGRLHAVLNDDPTPITELVPSLPAELVSLVHESLAKAPEGRPQTMDAVVERLERVLEEF